MQLLFSWGRPLAQRSLQVMPKHAPGFAQLLGRTQAKRDPLNWIEQIAPGLGLKMS
jgi:hypothetical protein